MNLQMTREKLSRKLTDVSEVAAGVLRGIRRINGRDVGAYTFDLNNRLPDTVGELSSYLDEVMGPAYFDNASSSDLRWNNYLYFVVEKRDKANLAFQTTKRNVEADRSYARKFVVIENDLDRILNELDTVAAVDTSGSATDVVQAWSARLGSAGMEDILDGERPITDVVRSISSGAAKQSVRTKKSTGIESSQLLVESHIARINVGAFRPYPKRKSFEALGKANLLFGSNGVGKTSLLEALEFLYCGANRRSNASALTTVEGLLVSGHSIKTSGQQLLSDFKTRQRLWYGGDDNSRQNKLPNQFARFNFLNTDAAAELSLLKEGSTQSNVESLAALLSGHEATLMWRRIQDVRKAVTEEIRSKRSERAVAEKDRDGKQKEISALDAIPNQSDAAFSIFIKDLERICWRDVPESKEKVTEDLVGTLSGLTSQFGAIQQLDWLAMPITENVIAQQRLMLQNAYTDLEKELPAIREDKRARVLFTQRHENAKSRIAALEAIPSTALAELKAFSITLKQSNDELTRNAHIYAALPSVAMVNDWQSLLGSKSLTLAKTEVDAELVALNSQLDVLHKNLAISTRTQSDLQRSIAELQNWSQKVIQHRHSDLNCPVCGTEFGPGELVQRIQALSIATSDNAILELRLRIEHLTNEQQQAEIEASWLGELVKFTSTHSDINTLLTVSDAQVALSNIVAKQKQLLEERNRAQQGLEAYARGGFSLATIEQLCQPIDADDQEQTAPLNITTALESAKRELQYLLNSISELDTRFIKRNEELRERIAAAGIRVSNDFDIAIQQITIRQRLIRRACDACTAAHQYLSLAPETDMRSLLTLLEASVLGAQKVQSALYSDSSSTLRSKTVRDGLTQLNERLSRLSVSIQRLTSAHDVLDDIIQNQSLDAASAAIVTATHKVADSIFGRIHAPAEYSITSNSETPLMNRETNLPVQLNQVSTGQRAAYALSMFLAMNAQVKTGPKVILLDDPISHIDDLNALSFLDYLRNLVINSDRQVFFATADEKIAGLFVHKFGFLGEEFRTIELARA